MAKKKAPAPTKLKFGASDVFPWHQVDHAMLAIKTARVQFTKLRQYGIIDRDWHEAALQVLGRGEQALRKLQRGEAEPAVEPSDQAIAHAPRRARKARPSA